MLGDRLDCAETLLKAGANVREFSLLMIHVNLPVIFLRLRLHSRISDFQWIEYMPISKFSGSQKEKEILA